jgi:hypothetical protein
MPAHPRFQPLAVEHRGYPVARIRDRRQDRDLLVYYKLGKLRYWDRADEAVDNSTLRRVAREALREAA